MSSWEDVERINELTKERDEYRGLVAGLAAALVLADLTIEQDIKNKKPDTVAAQERWANIITKAKESLS